MIIGKYDLPCQYDTRQNFYGKAKIEIVKYNNFIAYILYSYGTEVASIEKYNNLIIYYYNGKYSQTTTRHQKEFFRQEGLTEKEIQELFKNGRLEKQVDLIWD